MSLRTRDDRLVTMLYCDFVFERRRMRVLHLRPVIATLLCASFPFRLKSYFIRCPPFYQAYPPHIAPERNICSNCNIFDRNRVFCKFYFISRLSTTNNGTQTRTHNQRYIYKHIGFYYYLILINTKHSKSISKDITIFTIIFQYPSADRKKTIRQ